MFDSEGIIDPFDFDPDYEDTYLVEDDGATTVGNGGTGIAPGQGGTIPSYASRRRKKRTISNPDSNKELGGFQTSVNRIA